MVLFFVRVILFFMSRGADDAVVPAVPKPIEKPRASHRTSSRHESIAPTEMPDSPEGDDAVTREEILKLFGGALRVR